ncbi:MAG: cytochrome c biogenesis protein CcdA [Candidatus Omnitrophota bacterium]|nr:cytochrome c biogenesis protein CcdA [Candidatus Omnitrophota bacterium]
MQQGPESVTIVVAFIAGLISFLSPCVLPLIPSYLSYITGITFSELTQEALPKKIRFLTAAHSMLFICGFTAVFIILGLSFTFLSGFLLQYQNLIKKIGGIIVVLFGLNIAGFLNLGFLQKERKLEIKSKPMGYLGSFLVGAVFSLGWTPCVGPALSSILILGSTTATVAQGAILLLSYSLGLGIPFFISSLLINNFLSYFKRIKRYLRIISVISGLFIVAIGVMIFTDYFGTLSGYLGSWLSSAGK